MSLSESDPVLDEARIAAAVLQQCLDRGVREFCVCAGSRNSLLVLTLLNSALEGVTLHGFFDERSAGFFALGRILASDCPVAVLTTSGTAVAELLPSTIEAHYQGLPLVLITADRPGRFRGTGAPQAIEQERIFGPYALFRQSITAPKDILPAIEPWEGEGPLHLNVRFEEPDAATSLGKYRLTLPTSPVRPKAPDRPAHWEILQRFLNDSGPLLIVLGCCPPLSPKVRADCIRALQSFNAPLVAEATSGFMGEPDLAPLLIQTGDPVVRSFAIGRVLRIGGIPCGRYWRDFENRPEIKILSITERGFPGIARGSYLLLSSIELLTEVRKATTPSPGNWRKTADSHAAWLEELIARYPESEIAWIRRISEAIEIEATVFLGNSLPIREWNLAARSQVRCIANRGANGIDGCLSTYLGAAANADVAWGIFGDLTTLYDLSAPWILPKLKNQRFRFVIIHNGGGRIFRGLPNFRGLPEQASEVVENRHDISFAPWATMWGLDYRRYESADDSLNDLAPCGNIVIEIRPQQSQSDAFEKAWRKGPSNP